MKYDNPEMNKQLSKILNWDDYVIGNRTMHISPNYAYYSNLSTILIQWEGSSAKGTLFAHSLHGCRTQVEFLQNAEFDACMGSGRNLRRVGVKQRDLLRSWTWRLICSAPIALRCDHINGVDYNNPAEVEAEKNIVKARKELEDAESALLLIQRLGGKR